MFLLGSVLIAGCSYWHFKKGYLLSSSKEKTLWGKDVVEYVLEWIINQSKIPAGFFKKNACKSHDWKQVSDHYGEISQQQKKLWMEKLGNYFLSMATQVVISSAEFYCQIFDRCRMNF